MITVTDRTQEVPPHFQTNCEDCNVEKPSVTWRRCPFMEDVREVVEYYFLCDSCELDRSWCI